MRPRASCQALVQWLFRLFARQEWLTASPHPQQSGGVLHSEQWQVTQQQLLFVLPQLSFDIMSQLPAEPNCLLLRESLQWSWYHRQTPHPGDHAYCFCWCSFSYVVDGMEGHLKHGDKPACIPAGMAARSYDKFD